MATVGTGTVAGSYYLSDSTPCWFLSGGIGISSRSKPYSNETTWRGLGLFVGGGYEFSTHWYLEGGVNFGDPSICEREIVADAWFTSLFLTVDVPGY